MTQNISFRVYRCFTAELREAFKSLRGEQSLATLLHETIVGQLPELCDELRKFGLGDKPKSSPWRLPMAESDLAALRKAAKQTGVPAVSLLFLLISRRAADSQPPAPPKPERKPRKAASQGRKRAIKRTATR